MTAGSSLNHAQSSRQAIPPGYVLANIINCIVIPSDHKFGRNSRDFRFMTPRGRRFTKSDAGSKCAFRLNVADQYFRLQTARSVVMPLIYFGRNIQELDRSFRFFPLPLNSSSTNRVVILNELLTDSLEFVIIDS